MTVASFFCTAENNAHYNMAFDEWLLARAIKEPGSFFLRLYTWPEGAITFGVNQRQETALDFSRLGGTPVIRRVTGGRALYHDRSELTYAVAFNYEQPPAKSLAGSISHTSEIMALALQSFLERVGVQSDRVRKSSSGSGQPEFFHKAPCFASVARYELMGKDRKIVASAQRRLMGGLLQQGSIKLGGVAEHPALGPVASVPESMQAITVEQLNQYAELFRAAFGDTLDIDIRLSELSLEESDQVVVYSDFIKRNSLSRRLKCVESLSLLGLETDAESAL